MKIRTLGLSGFDRSEEVQFRALFAAVAAKGWELAAEADSDALVIDFDSMYGQMSWLRAQGGTRLTVALTAGSRADATFVLKRPVSERALAELLTQLNAGLEDDGLEPDAAADIDSQTADDPLDNTAVEEPAAAPVEPAAPPVRRLLDYLQPGVMAQPALLLELEPPLVIDVAAQVYYGSGSLKALVEHARLPIEDEQWQLLDADQLARWQEKLQPEPLTRLRWLAGLSAGGGSLLPELAAANRFKLNKWPQAEREFPKLFRVATALLKQHATVEELASASGVSASDVCDFINACHAIGLIDAQRPASDPAQAGEGAAKAGLLGRFLGKS